MIFAKCHICAECNGNGHVTDLMTGNEVTYTVCNGSGHICEDETW